MCTPSFLTPALSWLQCACICAVDYWLENVFFKFGSRGEMAEAQQAVHQEEEHYEGEEEVIQGPQSIEALEVCCFFSQDACLHLCDCGRHCLSAMWNRGE